MSIAFKHRVVQWAIYRVINPMLVPGYIRDSYGCIPGRGSLSAMKRLKYWLEQADRRESESWYYLKLDISKYFYRVSHRILKKVLAKKIKDKRLLEVLYAVIDCRHTPFGLPPGKKLEEVPLEERLYDVGMPIGNLLSQMFANIYLDVLDQFCKRTLGIRHYVRYMDDIIILSNSKAQLRGWKDRVGLFLESELELNLNNKTCIRPIGQGIEFVGYRVWAGRVVLRKSTTLRIKRCLKGIRKLYSQEKIPLQKAMESFICYIAMLKHTDSEALVDKLYEDMVLVKGDRYENKEEGKFVPVFPQEELPVCNEFFGMYEGMPLAWQV